MTASGRRRAYGQHFLDDPDIANQIASKTIELALEYRCAGLLEIGPGKGALTHLLHRKLRREKHGIHTFLICERDQALARFWKQFSDDRQSETGPMIKVYDEDFLSLSPSSWLQDTPLAVVSNLPYSAGAAILSRLALHPKNIPVMVLMFQAEVARRIRAMPGTKAWGSLSVWIQNEWDVQKLVEVPPRAFNPPPQVQSETVILFARTEPRIPIRNTVEGPRLWDSLLKACFSHRRKMLRSGLRPSSTERNALELSGLDGTKRAEALSWEEWARLYRALLRSASKE